MLQPSVNAGRAGRSFGSPSGAPASDQRAITSFSDAVRPRSFSNVPIGLSACHGGIDPSVTRRLIARAQGRASAYVMSDIGADSPGRWQVTQFLNRIGATSLEKVGVAAVPVGGT